jgi:hypothetical protein
VADGNRSGKARQTSKKWPRLQHFGLVKPFMITRHLLVKPSESIETMKAV